MIQPQLFIDTGFQEEKIYTLTDLEFLTTDGGFPDVNIELRLNNVVHTISISTDDVTINAAEVAAYVNTLGTHKAWRVTGGLVTIESYTAGAHSNSTFDPLGSGSTATISTRQEIFIENTSKWQSCDIDPSVSITIKDSIKKAKDVGKVFTSFTHPFNLPASKNNNIIFKRFSNNKVYEGFDPRRKYSARIKLNGIDFKTGYLKLNKVAMVDNLPISYSCQFFGELASLKDVLSDSKLKSLTSLSKYTFPYDNDTVILGFEDGFDVVPNSPNGEKEVSVLQVIDAPTSNGDVNLNLNGIPHVIPLIGTGGVTAASTAEDITRYVNLTTTHIAGVQNERFVYIIAKNIGQQQNTTLGGAAAIGMTYTIVTPVEGNSTPQTNADPSIVRNTWGDFKFPFISHTRGFEYTKTPDPLPLTRHEGMHRLLTPDEKNNYYRSPTFPFSIGEQNLTYPAASSDRISRFDLKPAMNLKLIFEAIEDTYPSITFDKEWLFGSDYLAASPIDDMYLWLHNRKGYLGYIDEDNNSLDVSWTRVMRYNGGDDETGEWTMSLADSTYDFRPYKAVSNYARHWSYAFKVDQMVGDGDVTLRIEIFDEYTNALLDQREVSGSSSDGQVEVILNYPFETYEECVDNLGFQQDFYVKTTLNADSSIGELLPTVNVEYTFFDFQHGQQTIDNNLVNGNGWKLQLVPNIDPSQLMPNYKTIDFLSDLFKMYNLVAFEVPHDNGDVDIKITSYDFYINNGIKYDITKYIDISKGSVERISPFSVVTYDFAKPKTFLAINQATLVGDSFGNAAFNVSKFSEGPTGSNSLLFDGGEYKTELKVEKMMYERLSDSSGELTPIQWGWFVNDNEENVPEPTLGAPLMCFINKKAISNYPIQWATGHDSYNVNVPSNATQYREQTLHFNSEYDEYHRDINRNSLFLKYHSNMIEGLYSPFAKKIRVNAQLPPLMFNKIRLSDTIIVDNVSYFIDEMDINITTGKTKFSLLRVTDIKTRLEGKDEGEAVWQDADAVWETEARNWEVKRNI